MEVGTGQQTRSDHRYDEWGRFARGRSNTPVLVVRIMVHVRSGGTAARRSAVPARDVDGARPPASGGPGSGNVVAGPSVLWPFHAWHELPRVAGGDSESRSQQQAAITIPP